MLSVLNAREAHAKLAALDRVQGVIEFDLAGRILSANSNFLDVVGYTLPEIVGQHHSLFMDPVRRESQAYRDFWDRLRSGAFETGQFERVGRGGRPIWIQASYNPMLDIRGRPYKVVKFATDITAADAARRPISPASWRRSTRSQAVIEFRPGRTHP